MRYRPQLCNPPQVHDVRSVNAEETGGVKHGLNRVHGHVQEVARGACVQPNVVLESLDPIYLIDGQEDGALAQSDRESL